MGDLQDALAYALGAGELFSVNDTSEYAQTILARCIDAYTLQRTSADGGDEGKTMDPRLVAIVERLLDRCILDGQYTQAVGIALETRRLDQLEKSVERSSDRQTTLRYALEVTQKMVVSFTFREQALRLIARLLSEGATPDYASVALCLAHLHDANGLADIIVGLLKGSDDDALKSYQIAFDLYASELSVLRTRVQTHLNELLPESEADAMEPDEEGVLIKRRSAMFLTILSGKVPLELEKQFLARHCSSDLTILKNMKNTVETRNSVCHGAVVFANAIMHSGTTVDTFLRDNLDWLSRATNWSKFSATAGLGVIHKGQIGSSKSLMSPYLPTQTGGSSPSPYSEGGALYAMGLIQPGRGDDIRSFLIESLGATQNEVVQHGACLGLGLALLGSCDEEAFEEIKNVLYSDNAVAGSAAGMALGLLFAGSGTDYSVDMLAYAHDTQHDKIIRGLSVGLAIIQYGREDAAEVAIEAMTGDLDAVIRQGGMMALGLAYRGTSNNSAIARLLHFTVSDVSDDVRRTAVMSLGYVLLNAPEQCPKTVGLLTESYNPHVRYGAAMAIGISAAGTGIREAVALIEPMLGDSVDFVQQGALQALALVLCNQPAHRTKLLREKIDSLSGSKAAELLTRMGAIMAAGILDAGGRNSIVSPRSPDGHFKRTAIIGLALFTQHWYWYPLSYTLCLALSPAALIGVDGSLKVPLDFRAVCNAKASSFAPPPAVSVDDKKLKDKVPTAVLSTTRKAQARKTAAKKKAGEDVPTEEMQVDDQGEQKDEISEPKEEPSSFTMENPSRLIPAQHKYVHIPSDQRFQPVAYGKISSGFVVLKDTRPEDGKASYAFVDEAKAAAASDGEAGGASGEGPAASIDEPPPPEPFEYIPS